MCKHSLNSINFTAPVYELSDKPSLLSNTEIHVACFIEIHTFVLCSYKLFPQYRIKVNL